MERTLMLVKPDAVQRRLIGQVVARIERKGLKVAALKMLRVGDDLAQSMYAEHAGKDFHRPLMAFITSGPVVAMVIEGRSAVAVCRKLIGPTSGTEAPGGTIRGDFGMSQRHNLVHGSDSPESAKREIALFFGEDEIVDYRLADNDWVYARKGDELV